MAKIYRGSAPQYPTSPVPGASLLYEADNGINVATGLPVPTWASGIAGGPTLTVPPDTPPNLPIPTAPTMRAEDNSPYVAFDGVANILGVAGLVPYTGVPLTAYLVCRPFFIACGIGNKIAMCLTRAGVIAGVGTGTMRFNRNAGETQLRPLFENTEVFAEGPPSGVLTQQLGVWSVYALRMAVVSGDIAYWHTSRNGVWAGNQFGPPGFGPLIPYNYSRFALGGQIDLAPGFPNDMMRVDIRAAAVYHLAHTDEQMKNMTRYLAHKWKVPVLD